MRDMSHFPPFAQMAALRSNSKGLIHLNLEEVLKDSALKTDPKTFGAAVHVPGQTQNVEGRKEDLDELGRCVAT